MKRPRRAQRDPERPELGEGLNNSWKAKGLSNKAKGHPSDLGGKLLEEIIVKVSEFPPTIISLRS